MILSMKLGGRVEGVEGLKGVETVES